MLDFDSHQNDFATELRRMLATEWPLTRNRQLLEAPDEHDPQSWRALSTFGLPGLLVPEAMRGAEASPTTVVLASNEIGRVLLPSPFWCSSVVSTAVLTTVNERDVALSGLADGTLMMTNAFLDSKGSWGPHRLGFAVETGVDGFVLTGCAPYVPFAQTADQLLLAARDEMGEHGLYLIDLNQANSRVISTPLLCLDTTRPMSRVELNRVPARRVARGDAVQRGLDCGEVWALVTQWAEAVGAAESCLDMTLEHVSQRVQFGRTIGSFQAVKHRCADMYIRLEATRSAVFAAADALGADPHTARHAAYTTAAFAGDRLLQSAADTIQLHGGMGFTWEHSAHLYFRRAESDAALLGSAQEHRRRLSTTLNLHGQV